MIPIRLARELTYQLEHAGEHERLAGLLAQIPFFLLIHKNDYSDVLEIWKKLSAVGLQSEVFYQTSLDRLRRSKSSLLSMALEAIAGFAYEFNNLDFSIELSTEQLSLAEHSSNLKNIGSAYREIGACHWKRSELNEAMASFEKSLVIARQMKDEKAAGSSLVNIAMTTQIIGEYERSLGYLQEAIPLFESSGYTRGLAYTFGQIGQAYWLQGKTDLAFPYFERQFELHRSCGDRIGMSKASHNMGVIFHQLGQFDKARTHYDADLELCETLGDKSGEALTIGNMAILFKTQGKFQLAQESYEKELLLSIELREPDRIAKAQCNYGSFLIEAMKNYRDGLRQEVLAMKTFREIGSVYHLAHIYSTISEALLDLSFNSEGPPDFIGEWIGTVPDSNWESVTRSSAMEYATNALSNAHKMSNGDLVFSAELLLIRIDSAEGDRERALQKLQEMLAEAADEEQMAELHYWLWKIGEETEHKNEAQSRYESLWQRIPKFEFLKRIAELRGEPIPHSADDLIHS